MMATPASAIERLTGQGFTAHFGVVGNRLRPPAAMFCGVAFLLSAGHGNTADRTVSPDVEIDAKSFRCITKMTPVRHFYVDNLRGDLDAALAAANSPPGAVYPPDRSFNSFPARPWSSGARVSTSRRMTGSSSNSTCRRTALGSENEDSSTSSIDSAGTALDVTLRLVPSGISFTRPTTAARRFR